MLRTHILRIRFSSSKQGPLPHDRPRSSLVPPTQTLSLRHRLPSLQSLQSRLRCQLLSRTALVWVRLHMPPLPNWLPTVVTPVPGLGASPVRRPRFRRTCRSGHLLGSACCAAATGNARRAARAAHRCGRPGPGTHELAMPCPGSLGRTVLRAWAVYWEDGHSSGRKQRSPSCV